MAGYEESIQKQLETSEAEMIKFMTGYEATITDEAAETDYYHAKSL